MSKQRKLRNKLSFDEDEAADGAPPPPPPPTSSSSGGAGAKAKQKKSALLSFGDDEDSVLTTKPPKEKKKDKAASVSKFHRASAAAAPAPAAAPPAAPAQHSSAGEYTAEKLAALQAATQKLPSKFKQQAAAAAAAAAAADAAGGSSNPAEAAARGVIKLSGSFKQAPKASDDRFSYSYSIHGTMSASHNRSSGAGAAAVVAARQPGMLPGPTAVGSSRKPSPSPGADMEVDGAAGGDGAGEAMPLPPPPRPPAAAAGRNGAAAPTAATGDDDDGDDDDDGGFSLPDEETIRLAKAKRERLRQAHLAPDYLPLGGASRLISGAAAAAAAGLGSASGRAARSAAGAAGDGEDAEMGLAGSGSDGGGSGSDGEAELEERMRLTFVGKQQQQQQTGGRRGGSGGSKAAAAVAMAGGRYASTVQDVDDDEEEDGAAGAGTQQQRQLARAIRKNAAGSSRRGGVLAGAAAVAAAGGAGAAAGRAEAVRLAGESVVASLLEACGRATSRQRQLQTALQRTTDHLAGALEEADKIRADILAAGEKYSAVQSLKAFLADLASCLAAKAPLVEELGEELEAARTEAAAAARSQQQDDESILFGQAEAAVSAALAVLGRGGDAAAAAAAAEAAAAEAEAPAIAAAAGGSNGPQVDEYGRDLGLQRKRELARGAARRGRLVAGLLQQLQHLQQGGRLDLEAPACSSSLPAAATAGQPAEAEESEAVQQYKRRRREVLHVAPTVFADTDDQFASLAAVKGRLEEFKRAFPREYGTAYLGESAPALFAPFVRLELLQWEPLPLFPDSSEAPPAANGQPPEQQQQQAAGAPPPGFDSQSWYLQLFEYGLVAPADGGAAPAADDADSNLVPQLVESLILPMALHLVAKCWDPCQVAQSRAVASLVSDLFVYVPADREDMAQLLALTTGGLQDAAAAAVVPPWPSSAAAAAPVAQAVLQLRFCRAAGLLRGLMSFRELLSQQLLLRLALGSLVGQQLVPCLRSSLRDPGLAVARAEVVVQSLPASWFSEGAGPREAQPLVDVVASLARSLEQQLQQQQQQQGAAAGGGGLGQQQLTGLAGRGAALCSHLGLGEQARRLAQVFGMGGR